MRGLLEGAGELLGGGLGTPVLIAAALLAIYLAFKVYAFVLRLLFMLVAGGLALGVAPWSGAPAVAGPVADCAVVETTSQLNALESVITKRVTVTALSSDAACAPDGGLAAGTADVRLRSLYDVQFGQRTVVPR